MLQNFIIFTDPQNVGVILRNGPQNAGENMTRSIAELYIHYTGPRVCQKKLTKVVGYNFACVGSCLMKFGNVIDIGCKFFTINFKFISL